MLFHEAQHSAALSLPLGRSFFAGGADGGAEQFEVAELFDDGLVEAEVADGAGDAAMPNEAVSSLPGCGSRLSVT